MRVGAGGQALEPATAIRHLPEEVQRSLFVRVEHDPLAVCRPERRFVLTRIERQPCQRLAAQLVQPDLIPLFCDLHRHARSVGREPRLLVRALRRA